MKQMAWQSSEPRSEDRKSYLATTIKTMMISDNDRGSVAAR